MTTVQIVGLIVVAALAALAAARIRRRTDDLPDLDGGSAPLHDAAKLAYGYLDRLGSPLAAIARAGSRDGIGWFEESLRKSSRIPGNADARIGREQFRDYLRWARTVQ
ncbi:MAG TPA: hypothetical protein VMH86_15930 [Rhizomicrobium sp.]|nr:hypothetical protein [Rhizomicrobium sp.]